MATKSTDLARIADEAAIAEARLFTVCRYIGRDARDGPVLLQPLWDREEIRAEDHGGTPAGALAAAKARKAELGADSYGRRPLIYAVTENGTTVYVPNDFG